MTKYQMYINCTYISEVLRNGTDEGEEPYQANYLTGSGLRAHHLRFHGLTDCHVSETSKILYHSNIYIYYIITFSNSAIML